MNNSQKTNSTVDLTLTDSQNFLNTVKSRLTLLRGVYAYYTAIFVPAILGLVLLKRSDKYENFVEHHDALFVVSIFIALATSFALALSKIVARKRPINHLMYALFVISFAFMISGIAEGSSRQNVMILMIFGFVNGLALYTYATFATKGFLIKEAIFFVMGYLIAAIIILRFMYTKKLMGNIVFASLTLFISTLIMIASEFMCENKNFDMLPDDYVMGSMQLMTVLPLLREFFNYEAMLKTSS